VTSGGHAKGVGAEMGIEEGIGIGEGDTTEGEEREGVGRGGGEGTGDAIGGNTSPSQTWLEKKMGSVMLVIT